MRGKRAKQLRQMVAYFRAQDSRTNYNYRKLKKLYAEDKAEILLVIRGLQQRGIITH